MSTGWLFVCVLSQLICGLVICQSKRKVWRIATGHDWGAHEYINSEGYIQGFSIDLITAVCKAADMDCRIVWDKYQNCVDSDGHSVGGQGLMGHWYDGCIGYTQTLERIQIFDFGAAYLATKNPSMFYVKKEDASSFNPTDITGKKIGFVDGWSSSERCLARAENDIKGAKLPLENVFHYANPENMEKAVLSGEIDAGFSKDYGLGAFDTLRFFPSPSVQCGVDGNSVMVPKGSQLPKLWDIGFNKIRTNGDFKKMCEAAKDSHGHRGAVSCIAY